MQIKQGIRRNFARRVASYDRAAVVQRFMAEELLGLCKVAVVRARRILEIGCGTGYLTAKLRRVNPEAWLLAVDLDLAMINLAQQKVGRDTRTVWAVADGEAMNGGWFDLIVSNSTFQWFTCPEDTIRSYFRALRPGGWLAFATLGPNTFKELAAALKEAAGDFRSDSVRLIAATQFLGQENWTSLLGQAGFPYIQVSEKTLTINYPTVMAFLKAIQATGATNPQPKPFTPRRLQGLIAAYQESFGQNGSIPVSYEIIWVLAKKQEGNEN